MMATRIMEVEHQLIENVVQALSRVAAALERDPHANVTLLAPAVEFLRVYTDKLHHGKEETLFFPMLVKRGLSPQGCPIGVLNYEHVKSRALVRALAEQSPAYSPGKTGAKEGLLKTLREIFDLYQKHIRKEDTILFPVADRILTAADQAELSRQFSEVDRAIGFETVARLETFAKGLAASTQPHFSGTAQSPCHDCTCGP